MVASQFRKDDPYRLHLTLLSWSKPGQEKADSLMPNNIALVNWSVLQRCFRYDALAIPRGVIAAVRGIAGNGLNQNFNPITTINVTQAN